MGAKEIVTMIAEILITLSFVVTPIYFIVKWCFSIEKRLNSLEQKIDDLPGKIKSEFINQFMNMAASRVSSENNPLTAEQIKLRNRLIQKLQANIITEEEAKILKGLLEIEDEEAREKQKWDLVFAIAILLAAIALVLTIFEKGK